MVRTPVSAALNSAATPVARTSAARPRTARNAQLPTSNQTQAGETRGQGTTQYINIQAANGADIRIDVTDDQTDFETAEYTAQPLPESWNLDDLCAHELSAQYTVNDMLIDMNGSSGFSEDKAAMSTVPPTLFLQVTDGMVLPGNYVIGRDPFRGPGAQLGSLAYQRRIMLFLYANARMLLDAGLNLSNEHATFLAYLRLQVVIAGGVAANLEARAVYVDEYTFSTLTFADVDLSILRVTKVMTSYLNDHWLQYVALLRHLFVTRGHHYKNEYLDVINKTWTATTITQVENLQIPTFQHVLRTGLHCFGIRILHLLTSHGLAEGKLAKSFETRFNASPAGAAYIRTGWAVVENMEKALWYPSFYRAYRTQVDALRTAARYAERVGLRAHINAKLFNWSWTRIIISDAPVRALAPIMLGFLDSLERDESIKGQQTLNKRGDGGSAIRAQFSNVLLNEIRNNRNLETASQFFQGYIDRVAADQRRQNRERTSAANADDFA